MPFQAIPLAMHRNTGSPLSKLLLIYLTQECQLVPMAEYGGGYRESDMMEFYASKAAAFCQCSEPEIYVALGELERLQLAYPNGGYVSSLGHNFKRPEDRWDFLNVALPVSGDPAGRSRIKCGEDQMSLMWDRDGYRCATCGTRGDEVASWAVDHVIPRSVGGSDIEDNCQAICSKCNSRKGAKVHWVDFLGGRRG